MKTHQRCFVVLLLLSSLNFHLSTFAQGTAFTYQGRLNDGANPANGSYDLRFALFNASGGGSQVGNSITNSGTVVSNGLITATLDFGANFPGAGRWLEIGVRTNGAGTFTNLAPRQPITATPYAITASNVTGTVAANQLSGTLAGAQLSGTYTGAVTFNNVGNNFSGNGSGLANVNAATLNGLSSSAFWKLAGNSGTTPGANFVGTIDNTALELKVNSLRALRLEPDATSPNVIGGEVNNSAGGFIGVTIGGGGNVLLPNAAQGDYAVIGGGLGNLAEEGATVSGGISNQAFGQFSVVSGGGTNRAQGRFAVVSGGSLNQTMATHAVVAGGSSNVAFGQFSVVSGGGTNRANGTYSVVSGGSFNQAFSQAVVSGGSSNQAIGQFSVVSGGGTNRASGYASVVGGGNFNQATALQSTIGGGVGNASSSPYSVVGGGYYNFAIAQGATVGGGAVNVASGTYSTVGGGSGNSSAAFNSTVGGGAANVATNVYATVGGGLANLASGTNSTVGGGETNLALEAYTTVPGGKEARADQHGQMANASGAFSNPGDAQHSIFVMRTSTTNSSMDLALDGETNKLRINLNRTMTFHILVTARVDPISSFGSTDSAGWEITGVIKYDPFFGAVFVGTPTVVSLGQDVGFWSVTVGTLNGELFVTGNTIGYSFPVRWVARVDTAEVAW